MNIEPDMIDMMSESELRVELRKLTSQASLNASKTTVQNETNNETRKHIANVNQFMHIIIKHLMDRADNHDRTKTESPEIELFSELTPKLAGCTYNSEEYKKFLAQLKPALDHHYASSNNRHHPEHFPNGIDGMNLIDLIEMLVDWVSACKRHNDGNILKSIEINTKRFNISQQLKAILENTVKSIDELQK